MARFLSRAAKSRMSPVSLEPRVAAGRPQGFAPRCARLGHSEGAVEKEAPWRSRRQPKQRLAPGSTAG